MESGWGSRKRGRYSWWDQVIPEVIWSPVLSGASVDQMTYQRSELPLCVSIRLPLDFSANLTSLSLPYCGSTQHVKWKASLWHEEILCFIFHWMCPMLFEFHSELNFLDLFPFPERESWRQPFRRWWRSSWSRPKERRVSDRKISRVLSSPSSATSFRLGNLHWTSLSYQYLVGLYMSRY